MGFLQIGCGDRAERVCKGRADHPGIHKLRHLVQESMLRDHVLRPKKGTGEHEFPVQGRGLALQGRRIKGNGIVDEPEFALRSKHPDQRG